LRYTKSSLYERKVFKCIRRVRGKDLCVHGEDAKRLLAYYPNTPRDIQMCISRLIIIQILIFLKILSNYTIWDRLSQKTISRYCTFNMVSRGSKEMSSLYLGCPKAPSNISPDAEGGCEVLANEYSCTKEPKKNKTSEI
jgi:hypothetical protein